MPEADKYTGPVHPNNLEALNLGAACLRLGVPRKGGDWLQLDLEDWKILHALLSKPINGTETAASSSEALALLDEWAQASIKWMEKNR
jgi:hypothetical protein